MTRGVLLCQFSNSSAGGIRRQFQHRANCETRTEKLKPQRGVIPSAGGRRDQRRAKRAVRPNAARNLARSRWRYIALVFENRVKSTTLPVAMALRRQYFVYVIASRTKALYVGVTNNLERRVNEHKSRLTPGFAARYHIVRLVYFEEFHDVRDAIAREKQIKAWRREKKVTLIEAMNPEWTDLAETLS